MATRILCLVSLLTLLARPVFAAPDAQPERSPAPAADVAEALSIARSFRAGSGDPAARRERLDRAVEIALTALGGDKIAAAQGGEVLLLIVGRQRQLAELQAAGSASQLDLADLASAAAVLEGHSVLERLIGQSGQQVFGAQIHGLVVGSPNEPRLPAALLASSEPTIRTRIALYKAALRERARLAEQRAARQADLQNLRVALHDKALSKDEMKPLLARVRMHGKAAAPLLPTLLEIGRRGGADAADLALTIKAVGGKDVLAEVERPAEAAASTPRAVAEGQPLREDGRRAPAAVTPEPAAPAVNTGGAG